MPHPTKPAPIVIGALFSETGVTALIERTLARAVRLAVAQINAAGGVLGHPLEIRAADPGSDPRRAGTLAAEMLADGAVRVLFGCYTSLSRKTVLPVVERAGGLLFYPTFYEGFEFSPNCIYGGCAPNQNVTMLMRYLLRNFGRRFYLVGSNYVYPYESNRIIRDYLTVRGGEVVEERYLPLAPARAELERILDEIARLPDVLVVSTVVGDNVVPFYRGYRARGIDPFRRPISSLVTGEAEIAAIGPENATGHITSAPWFRAVDTPANRDFLAAYADLFGDADSVSAVTEAVYAQVHMFAQAAARAGDTSPASVIEVLPDHDFDAPQGRIRVDRQSHHTFLWPRIARVGADGAFHVLVEDARPAAPDPYLVVPEPDEGAWDPPVGETAR